MCGIFGLVAGESLNLSPVVIKSTINLLFKLSESRGKEAAGIAVLSDQTIKVFKQPIATSAMIRTSSYKKFINNTIDNSSSVIAIGHSRLVTSGFQTINDNNQPVIASGLVGVHNGIVVNNEEIWRDFPELKRRYEVDTEIILSLTRMFFQKEKLLYKAVKTTFDVIEGSASVAMLLNDDKRMVLATNTGSLYVCKNVNSDIYIFTSERYILETAMEKTNLQRMVGHCEIFQVKPWCGYLINLVDLSIQNFSFADVALNDLPTNSATSIDLSIIDCSPTEENQPPFSVFTTSAENYPYRISSSANENMVKTLYIERSSIGHLVPLRRCTRCILPETFPMISFDNKGVCNYCNNYRKMEPKGHDDLEKLVAKYRSKSGKPDCIVSLSGGRDSTYTLHYVKNILNMNPIAYTYDWGMVTDLARKNQARICGKLGIEHILISADINIKRKHIQKNIKAWLKRPDLGMIPLFMAGDKLYFYYANQLIKQTGIPLVFFSTNRLERTNFKSAFSGVEEKNRWFYEVSWIDKMLLTNYYLKQFILNPAYLNTSLLDTFRAFYSTYMMSHTYTLFFDYIKWDEKKIMSTLINEYNWEIARDTNSTWRIGDGTAAFYNYIYYTVAGFTENDTFRSNQVREGMITREEALRLVKEENKPRYETIKAYLDMVGLNFDETLKVIDSIPRLYRS